MHSSSVRTVFLDTAASQATTSALADDLGLATDVLHPVERVAAGDDYLGLMRQNLTALQRGLVCNPV